MSTFTAQNIPKIPKTSWPLWAPACASPEQLPRILWSTNVENHPTLKRENHPTKWSIFMIYSLEAKRVRQSLASSTFVGMICFKTLNKYPGDVLPTNNGAWHVSPATFRNVGRLVEYPKRLSTLNVDGKSSFLLPKICIKSFEGILVRIQQNIQNYSSTWKPHGRARCFTKSNMAKCEWTHHSTPLKSTQICVSVSRDLSLTLFHLHKRVIIYSCDFLCENESHILHVDKTMKRCKLFSMPKFFFASWANSTILKCR